MTTKYCSSPGRPGGSSRLSVADGNRHPELEVINFSKECKGRFFADFLKELQGGAHAERTSLCNSKSNSGPFWTVRGTGCGIVSPPGTTRGREWTAMVGPNTSC